MAFLRFFDLFWIAPAVQGKDAYASIDCLQIEFWTCLRKKEKDIYERDIKDKKKKVCLKKNFFGGERKF